jgi:hypothetical protein
MAAYSSKTDSDWQSQNVAQGMRDGAGGGLGGGGNEYHFHGPLVEAVANLLQENNNIVGRLVERHVKNNPSVMRRMVGA